MNEVNVDPDCRDFEYEHHESKEITDAFLAFMHRCSPSPPKEQFYTEEELDHFG
jgi:hypothetical protein